MLEYISGRNCDTDKAELLAEWCNGFQGRTFIYKALYRTEEGSYFIYSEGGPWTQYARQINGRLCTGWRIDLATEEEAESFPGYDPEDRRKNATRPPLEK